MDSLLDKLGHNFEKAIHIDSQALSYEKPKNEVLGLTICAELI